jgi:hypothetical protein
MSAAVLRSRSPEMTIPLHERRSRGTLPPKIRVETMMKNNPIKMVNGDRHYCGKRKIETKFPYVRLMQILIQNFACYMLSLLRKPWAAIILGRRAGGSRRKVGDTCIFITEWAPSRTGVWLLKLHKVHMAGVSCQPIGLLDNRPTVWSESTVTILVCWRFSAEMVNRTDGETVTRKL